MKINKTCVCCGTNRFTVYSKNPSQKYCKNCSKYINRYIGQRIGGMSSALDRCRKVLEGCEKQ